MPPQFVFEMRDVGRTFGEKVVLRDINLSFFYGAKIGVVGENGSGKSTLLRIMAGLDKDFDGSATLAKGMRVGYVAQEPQLDLDRTVRENLLTAMKPIQSLVDRFNEITGRMADPKPDDDLDKLIDEMGRLQEKIDAANGWELDRMMDIACNALVLPPDDTPVRQLSGGERRRVALGMALLEKPDLLLLDEPTNHLDAETIEWLEQTLREYPGTVIIVTHDRYFLDHITKWILELEGGRGLPFEGNYSSWLDQKAQLLRIMEKRETQRQKTLERELEWIRRSHQGRQQKNEARVKAYEQLAGQQIDPVSETIIQIAPGPRLGEKVLQFHRVSKSFAGDGGPLTLLRDCSFDVPRGAIVGLIGPNGTGKTTLLRMIVGQEDARRRHDRARPQRRAFLRRSAPRRTRRRQDRVRRDHRRGRPPRAGQRFGQRPRLCGPLQLPQLPAAEEGGRMLRRRAEPHPPGQNAPPRRQPAAARRAHQRPRRGHDAGVGAGDDRLRRLRPGNQPRPVLPRSHLDAPAGHGRGRAGPLVRGQFCDLRGGRAGRESRSLRASPRQVPAADRQAPPLIFFSPLVRYGARLALPNRSSKSMTTFWIAARPATRTSSRKPEPMSS